LLLGQFLNTTFTCSGVKALGPLSARRLRSSARRGALNPSPHRTGLSINGFPEANREKGLIRAMVLRAIVEECFLPMT
jgi:hypothetical protein